jgi:hypothetical protein
MPAVRMCRGAVTISSASASKLFARYLKSEVSSPPKLQEACAGGALCAHPEGTPPRIKMIARIARRKNARFSICERTRRAGS